MPMLTGGLDGSYTSRGGGSSYTTRGGGRRTTTTSSFGSGRRGLRSAFFFGGSGSTRRTGALTFIGCGCVGGDCRLQGQVGPASATFCGKAALAAATAGMNSGRL